MPALRRAATSEEKQALLVKDQESQSPEDDGAGGDTFSWQGANKSEASLENVTIDALFLNFEYVHKLPTKAPTTAVEMLMNLDRAFQLTEYDRRRRQSHLVALFCIFVMLSACVKAILESFTIAGINKAPLREWYVTVEIVLVCVVSVIPFAAWAIFTAPLACSRRQYRFLGSELVSGRVIPAVLFAAILTLELVYTLLANTGYGMTMTIIAIMYTFFPIKIIDAHCLASLTVTVFCIIVYVVNMADYERPQFLGGKPVGGAEPLAEITPWPKRFARCYALIILSIVIAVDTHRRTLSAMRNFLVELVAVSAAHKLKDLKQQSDDLLASMLPPNVVERLKRDLPLEAEYYPSATVIFCEICNFDRICASLAPNDVVRVLNIAYSKFDELLEEYGSINGTGCIYKVETVGEVYMAVCGCPIRVKNHAHLAASFALDLIASVKDIKSSVTMRNFRTLDGSRLAGGTFDFQVHVGLNSGPINAGIVGLKSPRYKLFGDTVNTASRMESTCAPGEVQCSAATAAEIESEFELEPRVVEVKGKGRMRTAVLRGRKASGKGAPLPKPTNVIDPSKFLRRLANRRSQVRRGAPTLRMLTGRTKRLLFAWRSRALQFAELDEQNDAEEEEEELSETCYPLPRWFSKARTMMMRLVSQCAGTKGDIAATLHKHHTAHEDATRKDSLVSFRVWSTLFIVILLSYEWPYHFVTIQGSDVCAPNKFQSAEAILADLNVPRPCGNDFNGAFADDAAVLQSHMLALHMFCAPMITLLVMFSFLLDGSVAAGASRRTRLIMGVAVWFFMIAVGMGVVYAAEHWRMFHFGGVIDDSIVIMHVLWMFHVPFVSTIARIFAGVIVVACFIMKQLVLREKAPGADMAFLVLYCVLAMVPMVLNEHYSSYNFVRNTKLEGEKNKIELIAKHSHLLLCRILPEQVVDQMHSGRKIIADHFRSVTIVFTDLKGFTKYSSTMTPSALLEWLNNMCVQ